jgi:uncharacterized Zn finger protein
MNINSFENDIDPKILSRGKDYFKDDLVENLELTDDESWEAEVCGSDIYYVSVKLKVDKIVDWNCDCPYDWGPVCKHSTAVFYAIRKNRNNVSSKKHSTKSPSKSKKKNKQEQIEEILNSAKLNDFKEFIEQQCGMDSRFQDLVLAGLGYLVKDLDYYSKYQQIVRSIISDSSDRHGFIDYYSMSDFSEKIYNLIQNAINLFEKGKLMEASVICLIVVKEYCKITDNIDDSAGETSGIFSEISEFFEERSKTFSEQMKSELFELFKKEADKTRYADYGLDEYLDKILVSLAGESGNRDKLIQFYKNTAGLAKQNRNEFREEVALENIINLYRNSGEIEKAEKIVFDNIRIHRFRILFLDKLIEIKEYEKAYKIAEEGLKIAKIKKYYGNINGCEEILLRLAELMKDKKKILYWTERRFESSSYDLSFYKKIKKQVSKDKWEIKFKDIITKLKKSNYSIQLQAVYYEEKMYSELLVSIQNEQKTFWSIENKYIYLLKDIYPIEILSVYKKMVQSIMHQTGRKVYEEAARLMKKMLKIKDGDFIVKELIQNFNVQYKNRRAMLEIFKKNFRNL